MQRKSFRLLTLLILLALVTSLALPVFAQEAAPPAQPAGSFQIQEVTGDDGKDAAALGKAAEAGMSFVDIPAGMSFFNETEPNDTAATANALPGNQVAVLGNIPAADYDYFSFTANAGDRVYAAAQTQFSNASGDSRLDIMASDGTTSLEFDDDSGSFTSLSSAIGGTIIPAAGTYYVRVYGFSATTVITPYFLHVRVQSGTPTAEVEPNNDLATATPLAASQWMSGTIAATTDPDFFSFTLNAGDSVYLGLDMDPGRLASNTSWNGRLGMGIFAGNQILVANDGSTTKPHAEAFFMTVQQAGTYYAYVDSTSTTGLGANARYNLSVSIYPKQVQQNCTTFTSADVPKLIGPGVGTATSTIVVPGTVTSSITDINATIVLTHSIMADLDVTLVGPTAASTPLFTDVGSAATGGQTQMNVGLDDQAALPIGTYTVVSGMVNQPEQPGRLGTFNGTPASGIWTLQIADDTTNTSGGRLQSWSLEICGDPPPAYAIELNKTVGTEPAVCATTDSVTVPPGGFGVYYCYTVRNTGLNTLNVHDLVDSELGTIFTGVNYALAPGATYSHIQPATIYNTVTNTGTWTASAGANSASDSDTATVNVRQQMCPVGYQPVTVNATFFDNPFPPAGWTVTNTTTNCNAAGAVPQWTNTNPGNRANLTGGVGPFAIADSDKCGSGSSLNSIMSTGMLDFTGMISPTVSFNADYDDFGVGDDRAILASSTDGGATWAPLFTWDSDHRGPLLVTQALPGAGENDVMVRWDYASTWDWWWEVDNAFITACEPIPTNPAISLTKTVGTDPLVCATTGEVTLPPGGGDVTYCYSVENTGDQTLTRHDLVDSELGALLNNFTYSLAPGASVFLTATTNITVTTINTATWTAYNAGPIDLVSATDSATVFVPILPEVEAAKDVDGPTAVTLPTGSGSISYTVTYTNPTTLDEWLAFDDVATISTGAVACSTPTPGTVPAGGSGNQSVNCQVDIAPDLCLPTTAVLTNTVTVTATVSEQSVSGDSLPLGQQDIYSFEGGQGTSVSVLVDTVSTATAFDIEACLSTTTDQADCFAFGDDQVACTFAPPAFGCPAFNANLPADGDGVYYLLVESGSGVSNYAGPVGLYEATVTASPGISPLALVGNNLPGSFRAAGPKQDAPSSLPRAADWLLSPASTTADVVTVSAPPVTITVPPSDPGNPQCAGPQPLIDLDKTVGTVPGVCATTDKVTVPYGTMVYYCYQIENTGNVTMTVHTLVDDQLGTLATNLPYVLPPGAFSPQVIVPDTAVITVTNTATWTAASGVGYVVDTNAAFNYIPINTTGTALLLADDGEANITIPWGATFFGSTSSDLRVGNNGGILFGVTTGDLGLTNAALPTAAGLPAPAILPFWDDIDSDTGDVYWEVQGTSPNRILIVEWYNRPHFSNIGSVTFEAILYEATNQIKYQYADVDFGDPLYSNGASATVGINKNATTALQVSFNQPVIQNGQAILFSPVTILTASDSDFAEVNVRIPNIDVDPLSMSSTQPAGSITSQTLNIGNTGGAPLSWEITETQPDRPARAGVQAAPEPVFDVPAAVTSEKDCAAFENYLGNEPDGWAQFCGQPAEAPASSPSNPTSTGYTLNLRAPDRNLKRFTLNNWPGQTVVGAQAANIYGMDFDSTASTLYALNVSTNQLGTLSTTTGAFTSIVACPAPEGSWTGLSIDPTTDVFYASTAANLYTLNPATCSPTLIGPFGIASGIMIDIAVNPAGAMYGHDIFTDSIYTINTTTGAATLVGPTGFLANFAQGMDFDNEDGTLYIFLYVGTGVNHYGTVNLATGAVTALASTNPTGEFEGATQTLGLCIPNDYGWLSTSPITGTTAANNVTPVTVTFDATSLSAGTYTGQLCIRSNDPDNGPGNETSLVQVPVTLTVEAATAVTLTGLTTGAALDKTQSPLPIPAGLPVAALPAVSGLALAAAYLLRRKR